MPNIKSPCTRTTNLFLFYTPWKTSAKICCESEELLGDFEKELPTILEKRDKIVSLLNEDNVIPDSCTEGCYFVIEMRRMGWKKQRELNV